VEPRWLQEPNWSHRGSMCQQKSIYINVLQKILYRQLMSLCVYIALDSYIVRRTFYRESAVGQSLEKEKPRTKARSFRRSKHLQDDIPKSGPSIGHSA